ncbi:MAG: serine hydrolase, partial [Flavisolibacter sp.]
GTGRAINHLLDSMGFVHTRVNSRTEGRLEYWRKYGWGQTTPKEMAMLMQSIVSGQAVSRERSEQMLRLLGRNYWDDVSIAQIPPGVFIASKNGAVNGSRSEVMYVNGEGNRYIISVFTKNISDQGWQPGNEAWTLMKKISKITWDHFSN